MTIAMRRDAQMPTEETTVRGASEATVRYDPDGRMRGKPDYMAAQGGVPQRKMVGAAGIEPANLSDVSGALSR